MAPKRPHDASPANGDGAKRPRTSDESSSSTAAGGAKPGPSIQEQIKAAKEKAAALMSNLNKSAAGASSPAVRPPAPSSSVPSRPSISGSNGSDAAALKARAAEAKRRTDEMIKAQLAKVGQRNDNPRPGGIHPLLMDMNGAGSTSAAASGSRHVAPKFSTVSANARLSAAQARSTPSQAPAPPENNPYLQVEAEDEAGEDAPRTRNRSMRKGLTFNAPGRHIRAAEQARHEAEMEALKRRIEERARKAGMSELTAEERALRRPQPPDVEWWDQAFLPEGNYDAVALLNEEGGKKQAAGRLLIEGQGSPIDIYIQHPIPIPAPSDKIKVQPRGVMLTKKEQKKMRKMRRQAEREDKQDQIKMGLLPPDAPKVKLSNLMRVLASESVADPTKVEARVRREQAARQDQHIQTNYERMLTPEQKREKAEAAKQADLSKGVYTLVFKVRHLISPSHKYKVRKNAQQYGLTGMTVFGPNFAVIVVEGGHKAIKKYRRLMTVRIDWTDPKRPRNDDDEDDGLDGTPGPSESALTSNGPKITAAEQAEIANIDWTQNYCHVIFEGPLRDRNFGYGFKARTAETDGDAKEVLGPKLASFWDLAKREDKAMEEEGGL